MDDLAKERLDWLRHKIDYYGRYHDHKETMAWVATAFYLSALTYLLFNLDHVLKGISVPITVSVVAVFAFATFGLFLNMQFNRRWIANEMAKVFDKELKRLLDITPEQFIEEQVALANSGRKWTELIDAEIEKKKTHRCEAWIKLLVCGECPQDPYPLKSELATYSAVMLVTILAIALAWMQY